MMKRHCPIDFDRVNRAALAILPVLLERWLLGGRIEGAEYVVRNPRRDQRMVDDIFRPLLAGERATGDSADGATSPKPPG
jgi:hypothetical protein